MKGIPIVLAAVLSYFSMASVVADEGTGAVDLHAVEATVGQILEQNHYTQRKLDSNMAKQVLETYLESLDYDKLFFTQEDIDQIRNEYSSGLGDDILLGNLTSAKHIYEIFKQRVDQRVANPTSRIGGVRGTSIVSRSKSTQAPKKSSLQCPIWPVGRRP